MDESSCLADLRHRLVEDFAGVGRECRSRLELLQLAGGCDIVADRGDVLGELVQARRRARFLDPVLSRKRPSDRGRNGAGSRPPESCLSRHESHLCDRYGKDPMLRHVLHRIPCARA